MNAAPRKMNIPTPATQTIPIAENLFKALLLLGLLFGSFYLAQAGATRLDALIAAAPPAPGLVVLKWGFVLILAVVDGVLLIGLGVLAHDAVHRVLFRRPFWNEFWGGLLSALVLAPFYANRQFHLTHHSYAHQPGLDPENTMHNHAFVYAATVGSLIGLYEQYRLLAANLVRIHDRRFRPRVLKDVLFVGLAALIYFWLVPQLGLTLAYSVVPMILVFPLVFAFRALSDHYGVPPIEREVKKKEEVLEADAAAWHRDRVRRRAEVSGWVVLTAPWLEWLWSGVNYHEVHHKYPYLSHRYLRSVFEATRATQPYLVVRGYWRSLWQLRHRRYYATRADTRPFLSTPEF